MTISVMTSYVMTISAKGGLNETAADDASGNLVSDGGIGDDWISDDWISDDCT